MNIKNQLKCTSMSVVFNTQAILKGVGENDNTC